MVILHPSNNEISHKKMTISNHPGIVTNSNAELQKQEQFWCIYRKVSYFPEHSIKFW